MKSIYLIAVFLLTIFCTTPRAQQPAADYKHGVFSFNINLSDYSFLKTVRDSSFTNAIKQKDWLKPGNKSFGIGASYWKGLTKHIDFSGTLSGTLSNFPKKFVKGDSIGQAGFSTQLDALLHFRLFNNKAAVNPFLTGGAGVGYFSNLVAVYAPIGVGLRFRFNEGAFLVLQAQWRKALTDGISNDYMMYSLGFIQRHKTIKPKKEKSAAVIPATALTPATPVTKVADTDGDGVPDDKDNCPLEKGVMNGCPDSDNDGIADKDDQCKNVPGVAKYKGCPVPDADKDGVPDEEDKCPTLAGTKENNGCPEIKAEIKQKVDMAARQIFFAFASDKIDAASFTALDAVAAILKDNPAVKLKIEAHSDNKGSFGRNIYWSEQRAKAVADYFIMKGIAADRISFKGYGDTHPVADNATETGRSKNRRVEMKLSY
jgi:outer membrane protein OmpA-like peptidoglycan-associated protein